MADNEDQIDIETQKEQVAAYDALAVEYTTYANALRRVLEKACKQAIPEAIVQARAKPVGSFAEKCARKYARYKDPVNQFSDLCGARVIVQTLDQVDAVRQFIEANFEVLEADEKALTLGDDKFGYRDMHFVVQLDRSKAEPLGFIADEIRGIGDKKAEIQVRTWVQHAWADVLHDRIYKASLATRRSFAVRRHCSPRSWRTATGRSTPRREDRRDAGELQCLRRPQRGGEGFCDSGRDFRVARPGQEGCHRPGTGQVTRSGR